MGWNQHFPKREDRLSIEKAKALKPTSPTARSYQVVIPVEFRGIRYMRVLHSQSWQWGHLIDRHFRNKRRIEVPDDQFISARIVPDVRRCVVHGGIITDATVSMLINTGGIVVILESPHADEYSDDADFLPIIPLNGSKRLFFDHLEDVLRWLRQSGAQIPDGDVVLCNPVPFQASLKRLTRTRFLVDEFRNEIWPELFAIQELQRDFSRRVAAYEPQLVINACTGSVTVGIKKQVAESLELLRKGSTKFQLAVAPHPAYWRRMKQGQVSLVP